MVMKILQELFEIALYGMKKKIEFQKDTRNEYDPGKFGLHFEHIIDNFYGLYEQTEDDPFGDTWEWWVVQIHPNGTEIKILKHGVSSMREYHKEFFKDELDKVKLGDLIKT